MYMMWKQKCSLHNGLEKGRAIAKLLVAGFPLRRPGFASRQHVGFVVDKEALGQVSPSTSVSSANHSINFSIIIITQGWHNRPISGCNAEWTQLDSTPHYTNGLEKILRDRKRHGGSDRM
jgi:hypothetical protein